jgi:hypothetical protein
MTLRYLASLALVAAGALAGCAADDTGSSSIPVYSSANTAVSCPTGKGYQHPALAYRVCYPDGWLSRDYTAEPGGGGALSVVAFGPPSAVPEHVPSQTEFTPPIEVRVFSGAKARLESSLTKGNQVSRATIAGAPAERIAVNQAGPAQGSIILVVEYGGNTYLISKGPGSSYGSEFEKLLESFAFSSG